jgi:hypothetical protein
MKQSNFLIVCILLAFSSLNAQTGFRPGYVIKAEGDTLFGELNFRSEEQMLKACSFRKKDSTNVIYFSPTEINGYRFTNGKYFVSKEIDKKKVFMEFLIKGRVNIYFSTDMYSDHYYIEKDSFGLKELPYNEGFKIKGDNEYLVQSNKHIGLLNYYMQDAPGLQSEILNIKKPERKNLINLAKDYHNAVCEGDKCIIYENKPPKFKMSLEFLGGIKGFQLPIDGHQLPIDGQLSQIWLPIFSGGLLTHIWLPYLNENLYFKTGIILTDLTSINLQHQTTLYSQIPVQIEYMLPTKGIFLFRGGLGVSVNGVFPFLASMPIASVGVNLKINKRFQFSINYDIDFTSDYIIIPKDIFSQTFTAGINVIL